MAAVGLIGDRSRGRGPQMRRSDKLLRAGGMLTGCALFAQAACAGVGIVGVNPTVYTDHAAESQYLPVGELQGVQAGSGFLASGVIITPGWVLTAAHVADGTDGAGGGITSMTFAQGAVIGGPGAATDTRVVNSDWAANYTSSLIYKMGFDYALVHLTSATATAPAARNFAADEHTLVGNAAG